jgi:hypothetical protein
MSPPRPPQSGVSSEAFVLLPVPAGLSAEQRAWQQWVYQKAFEEAQAVARPSILERDLLAVWN